MELYLIRHPKPDIAAGICYGQSDIGLLDDPQEVAARLRPLLPSEFQLHASPLQRARLLAEQLGTPQLDERLMEIHFGAWEGQRFHDLGAAINAWQADPLRFRAPEGESVEDMARRVDTWRESVLTPALQQDTPQVVVAHGGPLRALFGKLMQIPPQHWLGLDFGCGDVTRLDLQPWSIHLKYFNR